MHRAPGCMLLASSMISSRYLAAKTTQQAPQNMVIHRIWRSIEWSFHLTFTSHTAFTFTYIYYSHHFSSDVLMCFFFNKPATTFIPWGWPPFSPRQRRTGCRKRHRCPWWQCHPHRRRPLSTKISCGMLWCWPVETSKNGMVPASRLAGVTIETKLQPNFKKHMTITWKKSLILTWGKQNRTPKAERNAPRCRTNPGSNH